MYVSGAFHIPVTYTVNTLGDGSTFCSREVKLTQNRNLICAVQVSFKIPEVNIQLYLYLTLSDWISALTFICLILSKSSIFSMQKLPAMKWESYFRLTPCLHDCLQELFCICFLSFWTMYWCAIGHFNMLNTQLYIQFQYFMIFLGKQFLVIDIRV